jgi:hypothetical protein
MIKRILAGGLAQGCQMVYFHTKNPNLGIFWRALEFKILVHILCVSMYYFTTI